MTKGYFCMTSSSAKKLQPELNQSKQDTDELLHFVENLKKQWVATIDAIPDPFIIVSKDYKIQKANAAMAEISGANIKSLIGKNCYQVFAGRNSPCDNCHMQATTKNKKQEVYEIRNKMTDRWYEVVSKSLSNVESKSESILQIYRDRTETIKLQHQLAQQEKLASIGQLAGGFAHEINNPLGGILVFAQMLLRELDKNSPQYQDVVEIELAAQRCKSIVEGMLDFARQRPVRGKDGPTNFHEAIESAVKYACVGHNQGKRCDTFLKLQATNFEGQGDKNRVIQVLLNLCTNALQAMPTGGTLTVVTANSEKKGSKFLEIEVSDTGTGIKKEHLRKIFDPFFTTKEPGQGTGLGLSVVHGMIQDMGGSIEVESALGRGTTFRIQIPLVSTAGGDGTT